MASALHMAAQGLAAAVRFAVTDDRPLLSTAEQIAQWLGETAVWSGGRCTWRLMADGNGRHMNEPIGTSLHAGTAGIALFLAECARVCRAPHLAGLAAGAVEETLNIAPSAPAHSIGYFTGRIGHVYAAACVGRLLDERRWCDRARALLSPLTRWDERALALDVYSGVAGTIAPLLILADILAWPEAADLALRLGELLVRRATRSCRGISWSLGPRWPVHLTGYAHGASGGAHALLELSVLTGRRDFREAATDAFRYERAFFDVDAGNWLDLSTGEMQSAALRAIETAGSGEPVITGIPAPSRRFAAKWCHGAAGIGLVRSSAARRLANPQLEREAIAAVRATVASIDELVEHGRFSLCHGVAGNIETLAEACPGSTMEAGWTDATRAALAVGVRSLTNVIASADHGRIAGVFDPGLMTGLPGIGWCMLRLLDPTIPSFLLPTVRQGPS